MGATRMIDRKHIVNLKGKDFVLWAGVLDAATKAGLRGLEVNLIQFPAPENGNLAIAQATATFEDGRIFTEIGDCGPGNCTPMIAPHSCRMACTRAKGRALRDALNIGETMFEELGPDAEHQNGHQTSHSARTAPQRARRDPIDEAAQDDPNDPACEWPDCPRRVDADQQRRSREHFDKVLCANHEAQLAVVRSKKRSEPVPVTTETATV